MGLKRDGGQRRARVKARSQLGRAKPHQNSPQGGKSEPRGTGAARARAPPVWYLPPAITPLVAAVVSRSSRRRPCANTVGLNAAHARHASAAACMWCLGHHAPAVVALHCAAPPPPPLRPSSGLVVARAHAHARASARGGGGGGERRRRIAIARFPHDRFPDGAVSSCSVASCVCRRVSGRRPAVAPLVVVLSGRGVKNSRRRRHSRVVCVRKTADCEVKSGALLRWRSPQALAMSHLRGLWFARDRNHQKCDFRSEVSHLSCIARAPGAPPSEVRPA